MKYAIVASFLLILSSACVKDSCINTFTIYQPVYKALSAVRAEMKTSAPQPLDKTGKIYLYKNFIFLNEYDKGVHIVDNSDPAKPVNLSFLPIPGNIDIAIKDNYLYADSYSDLVVFDISDISDIKPLKFLSNTFPGRGRSYYYNNSNPDSSMVIVDYMPRDTTVSCNTYNQWLYTGCINCSVDGAIPLYTSAFYSGGGTGTGGSMAAFTIINNHLYSIYYNYLFGFDISNGSNPQLKDSILMSNVGETIFPFQQKLFVGSPSGMFMYDVSNPENPTPLGTFSHVRSCDPVIADENNAYVTLRSGNACMGFTNQLDVLNISDLLSPSLIRSYSMTNPHGLSKDGNWLFICDGTDGLKIYDAADPASIINYKHIEGLETFDVITYNNIALVVAKDGLYQFDYSDMNNFHQISKIPIQHN